MEIVLDHILILKTNIKTEAGRLALKTIFDNNEHIQRWSLDLNDVDCVLRVVSPTLCYETIISLINHLGFEGAELE